MDATSANAKCRYCGLPAYAEASSETAYCCLGCRVADAIQRESRDSDGPNKMLMRVGMSIFFAMNVMVCTLALWSWDVYEGPEGEARDALWNLLRHAALLCSAPVFLLLVGPLAETAWSELRRWRITADVVLLAGVLASFGYSVISLWSNAPHVYFEVGCMILVAVTLGRWFEAVGRKKASESLRSLQRLLPETARRCGADGEREIATDSLTVNDCVRVLPGERIPVDGVLQDPEALLDEQLITGESTPRRRRHGDEVFGGTLVLDGEVTVRATAAAGDGAVQRIIEAVETAAAEKSEEQKLADRVAAYLAPGVLFVAMLAFVVHTTGAGFQSGLMATLSVVLIACPCALAIATPLAIWVAVGKAAERGVLFRNGDALMKLARVQAVCFDKTGTLTKGAVELAEWRAALPADRDLARRYASRLASGSNHPLAQAIQRGLAVDADQEPVGKASSSDWDGVDSWRVMSVPGKGVSATRDDGVEVRLGDAAFMEAGGMEVPSSLSAGPQAIGAGKVAMLGWAGQVRAVFYAREQVRAEAGEALRRLERLGLHAELLTGDRAEAAAEMEERLGLPARGGLLPADKQAAILTMRSERGLIAMVGDGVNDAPALASADVGIAMHCGADVSRDAAAVCLQSGDLTRIPWAIQLASMTRKAVRRNLFWALIYNLVGMGFAISGLLNPIVAAIAMAASSLFVIGGSLRISAEADALLQPAPASQADSTTSIESRNAMGESAVTVLAGSAAR